MCRVALRGRRVTSPTAFAGPPSTPPPFEPAMARISARATPNFFRLALATNPRPVITHNNMRFGNMHPVENIEEISITGTTPGIQLVTRNAYALALGCDPRTVKRKPDMFVKTSGGKPMEIFELRESAVEQFRKLRTELLG
jgi:hypothetical protein